MALSTVIAAALLAAAGAWLAAEFGLRLMGFHRFPLFAADPECGFRMRGAQAGRSVSQGLKARLTPTGSPWPLGLRW